MRNKLENNWVINKRRSVRQKVVGSPAESCGVLVTGQATLKKNVKCYLSLLICQQSLLIITFVAHCSVMPKAVTHLTLELFVQYVKGSLVFTRMYLYLWWFFFPLQRYKQDSWQLHLTESSNQIALLVNIGGLFSCFVNHCVMLVLWYLKIKSSEYTCFAVMVIQTVLSPSRCKPTGWVTCWNSCTYMFLA